MTHVRAAASLNAVVTSACACPAGDPTPVNCDPFRIPGGKPVTEVPVLTPRLPVTVVAFVLVTVDPARTAKPLADPTATGGWQLHADVAKLQTTSLANDVPAWLFAPVVI